MSTTLDSAVANDFEVQCAIVIKALKGSSGDERAKALRAAQLVVREIQTPVEFAGNQTWAVRFSAKPVEEHLADAAEAS